MMVQPNLSRIAFIHDDRLSHDRKTVFTRTMTILKSKTNMDILSSTLGENEVVDILEKQNYSLILLPWYKYLAWKKIESHFGALRMQGPTVAGYFADAILPFEFTKIPNFNRMLLLDFYRMDQAEIEIMVKALATEGGKSGIAMFLEKNTQLFHTQWYSQDHASTRCIDAAMSIPLFKSSQWSGRTAAIRIYLTALWTICFKERRSLQSTESCAELEISEVNRRLLVRLVFESHELTLKYAMEHVWPSESQERDNNVRELIKHADFMRFHHFPESHQVEVLAFFTSEAPSLHYPGEVRGFWIEPLKQRFLKQTEHPAAKRIPIHQAKREVLTEQVHDVLESLRSIHHQLSSTPFEERALLEHQISHIRFLIHEIEKKVAEKKKIA